jgi:hypothetical protein
MMLMDEKLMLLIVLVDRYCYIRFILSNPNAVAESNSIDNSGQNSQVLAAIQRKISQIPQLGASSNTRPFVLLPAVARARGGPD